MQSVCVTEVPELTIKDGLAYVRYRSGDEPFECVVPLAIWRRWNVRITRALAAYDAKRADVVPMRREGRG